LENEDQPIKDPLKKKPQKKALLLKRRASLKYCVEIYINVI